MTVAIHIEDVSKLYRLGVVGTGTITHDLNRWWARVRGKEDPYTQVGHVNDRTQASTANGQLPTDDSTSAGPEYVWALKDINLEVEQGEILGIIGRNGAGKSTLLKLLSRITAPTTGEIKTRGRIASLLEVGTGFHPELTGRENVFLNGTILGMTRQEVAKQLEPIVEFSGCAKYIDTPVKRYSSGMMVRLGFAVAAHLECEILIVDEVLAVGDVEFQRRCIGKMKEISEAGERTVLFVSHNMKAVRNLCSRAVVINQGKVSLIGPTDTAVDQYQAESLTNCGTPFDEREDRGGDGSVRFTELKIRSEDGLGITPTSRLRFELSYATPAGTEVEHGRVVIGVYDSNNTSVYRFDTEIQDALPRKMPNAGTVVCVSDPLHTTPGPLFVSIAFFAGGHLQDHLVNATRLDIVETDFFKTPRCFGRSDCLILVDHRWQLQTN